MSTLRQHILGGLAGAIGLSLASTAAPAALLSLSDALGNCGGACEGLTYTLEEASVPGFPLTEQFALVITGENTVTDTRFTGLPGNGRTGINAISFNLVSNNPDSPTSGTMVGTIFNGVLTKPDPRFTFLPGGIGSTGCDGSGNFYCFDNTTIPPTPLAPLITGPVVLGWEVTLLAGGSWANYTTALKIDWVGSENNYSLVSKEIPINTVCSDCIITTTIVDAPEPASIALLGTGLVGIIGIVGWRRRRDNETAIA